MVLINSEDKKLDSIKRGSLKFYTKIQPKYIIYYWTTTTKQIYNSFNRKDGLDLVNDEKSVKAVESYVTLSSY